MDANKFNVWRLVLDYLDIPCRLILFCVSRHFNQLYSEEDWTCLYTELSRTKPRESRVKQQYLDYYRQTLDLRLKGIRKHYNDKPFNMFTLFQLPESNPLDELDWSKYTLVSLYDLYQRFKEHEQKVYQARDNQLPMIDLGFQVFEGRLTKEQMTPLYEFSAEYRKTEPNPVKLVALVKASRDIDPLIKETADKILTDCKVM